MNKKNKSPVVLCIMDGWGLSNETEYNSVHLAKTPNFDELLKTYPSCKLEASGEYVGLPSNQIGNSEVGHMNIGSGRVILQSLPRIDKAFNDNKISQIDEFKSFFKNHNKDKAIHIIGLYSNGGVHSHANHIINMCKLASKKCNNIKLHLFTDGRDTLPNEFGNIVDKLKTNIPSSIKMASLIGRYYSMDRDNRWDRIEKAYNLIIHGKSKYHSDSLKEAIKNAYKRNETDEFVSPTIIDNYKGIENEDSLLIVNFRSDRVREILASFLKDNFTHFNRKNNQAPFKNALGMTEYSEELNRYIPSIFKNELYKETLGEIVSKAGLNQLRIAETEKYPHVTFFFNGGNEKKYKNEERILIPSPKIATYDLQPEMSAIKIRDELIINLQNKKYDFIVVNFANPDMVGHTGNLKATIKAVETVDFCIGQLSQQIEKLNGTMLITSDHGNCEEMWDFNNKSIHTAHTTNLVPFIFVNKRQKYVKLNDGKLADIAPTIIDLLGIRKSKLITGESLIRKN